MRNNFKFSTTSKKRLETCTKNLQKVFELAIKRSDVDFGIAEGHRSKEEQQNLYAQGRTKQGLIVTNIDGVNDLSKHNYLPSEAVDVYAWVNGSASWDEKTLCYLAGVIMSCAKELEVKLRWGGNWDSDGVIITDQNLIDMPHFEEIL